jgi:deoxyribodipyrimidine photo-lyase
MSETEKKEMISTNAARTRVIVWFRNDLRLLDNAVVDRAVGLYKKSARLNQPVEVLPVYVFDSTFFNKSERGMARFGATRGKFTLECVAGVKNALRALGSDLLVKCGSPAEVIGELTLTGANERTVVLTQQEVTSEETKMDKAVRKSAATRATEGGQSAKATLECLWGSTLYHRDDLPYDVRGGLPDLPDVFTPFRNKVEKKCHVRDLFPAPPKNALGACPSIQGSDLDWMPGPSDLPFASQELAGECEAVVNSGFDQRRALDFKGGEAAALARVQYYLWDTDLLATYFDTRNGMLGGDYSSKLAPWLALGCVSPRYIESEVRRYESQRTENKSTYWLLFELLWRDYFKFFALKHGDKLFHVHGITQKQMPWKDDKKILEAWRTGNTGFPLVDANMRELAATGFMSNRGRQNVASWLALDAGIDWRHGADWFEHHLLDYDAASNWGNWLAAAGMTGGRINRFNIPKQTKTYDPNGEYIKAWVPELKEVPGQYIADPHQAPRALLERIGFSYAPKVQLPKRQYSDMGGGGGDRRRGGGGGSRGGRGRGGSNGSRKKKLREFDIDQIL